MRIPVDETDPDVVLSDCAKELAQMRQELEECKKLIPDDYYLVVNERDHAEYDLARTQRALDLACDYIDKHVDVIQRLKDCPTDIYFLAQTDKKETP